MTIDFQNYLFTDAGAAVSGATVDLLTRNTTPPVLSTTSTSAGGLWTINYATQGRYDVRITNGSSVRWHKYDAMLQLDTLEVANFRIRNPADTFEYDIVPAAITAARTLNLPLITGTDTLATLGLAATFTATQTFTTLVVATNANPDADDGAGLGTGALGWSDLFLASGAVINFNNGNVTLTHAAGLLTVGGNLTVTGDLIISGDTVTQNVATISVEDPLIYLANGNTA